MRRKNYPHRMQREGCAAPDYKAMYFELFRANEQAIRLLVEAQQACETLYMESTEQAPAKS